MRLKGLLVFAVTLSLAWLAASCGNGDEPAEPGTQTATAVASTGAVGSNSVEMSASIVLHHWEAITAIKAGNLDDARHHIQHILDAVAADETHAGAMRDALAALQANNLDEAEHGIQGMLAGRAEPGLTPEVMHLQMAMAALTAEDEDEARHHIDHFMGLGVDMADAQRFMALLDEGQRDQAIEHLEVMLAAHGGEMPHGDAPADHETKLEADREVTVVMTEFAFEPNVIRAKVGERVRLVAINRGAVLHDITAEEFHGTVETVGEMEMHESTSGGGHADTGTFHAAAAGGETAELVFAPDEPAEYTLFCTVPGHRELGMTATLIVEP